MNSKMKWVYSSLAVILILVTIMEVKNYNKIKELKLTVTELQKQIDDKINDRKVTSEFDHYIFKSQVFCTKGPVKQVLIINKKKEFKYYVNVKKFPFVAKFNTLKLSGYIRLKDRRIRFFLKDNGKYELKHFGYLFDWGPDGEVTGLETVEETYHLDYCNEAMQ
ncbi:MAG: hypothetical protein KC493_02565 [Bacteriovoracaceae bacterium]|nr:hypothetical protein [Bacteriovoracaceae bacterium]